MRAVASVCVQDVHLSGRCLVSSGMDNTVKLWALDSPELQCAMRRSYAMVGPCCAAAVFSVDCVL